MSVMKSLAPQAWSPFSSRKMEPALFKSLNTQVEPSVRCNLVKQVTTPPSTSKRPYSGCPGAPYGFRLPVHYPKYTKSQYEVMPEWQIDRLLEEYGVTVSGSLSDKRKLAMGMFLWM